MTAAQPAPAPRKRMGTGTIALIVVAAVAVPVLLCGGAGLIAYKALDKASRAKPDTPVATGTAVAPAAGQAACTWQPAPGGNARNVGTPPTSVPAAGTVTMRIDTNLGTLAVRIDLAKTPCTGASFGFLAGKRYFDNSPCHRLVSESIYVLQCGDPTGTGSGRPGYAFGDENLNSVTGVYPRGSVAMANSGPDSNGSQFFIVFKDSPLPPSYTPFGTVTSGLSIVDKVAAAGDDGAYAQAGGGHPKMPVTLRAVSVS